MRGRHRRGDVYLSWTTPNPDAWSLSDRVTRCYAVVSGKHHLKKSLKGLGAGQLAG